MSRVLARGPRSDRWPLITGADHGVRGYPPQARGLIKYPVFDRYDLTRALVDQQRIIAIAHPDGVRRRRRQGIIHIVGQPVILSPEDGRQIFAEGPATRIP